MEKIRTLQADNDNRRQSVIDSENFDFSRRDFAKAVHKVLLRNLNEDTSSPTFYKYSKSQIMEYIKDPAKNEKALRDAIIYMYGASTRFARIIQYFAGLSDLSYFLSLNNVNVEKANVKTLKNNRLKTLNFVNSMNLKTQGREILTVCIREDVYYATCWVDKDNVTIQQLPSDYCKIASIENNVCNVTFNFSYFSGTREKYLEFYPQEFTTKYNAYKKDRKLQWQELDSPNSFAIKCNRDIKGYAMPPLVGVLSSLYDLADYQDLKLSQTELENYALLVMKLGMTNGEWDMDFKKAREFWMNLDDVMPDQVGSVLSPMPIEKIDFKNSGASETDKVAEAENSILTEAGVSSLIFNNPKASANALLLSIKADQAFTFSIVKSMEDAFNRLIAGQSFGKNYKITFIDSSPFNRKEMAEQYLKAATYGFPTISMYGATVGLNPDELETLNFLENDMLGLVNKFVPLRSSNTMSGTDDADERGRPQAEIDDLSDSGETSQEQQ